MKISRSLPIVLLSTIAFGFQSNGHAQGNLVNLYDWRGETQYGFSPSQGISIDSWISASFSGQYSTNGRGNRNDIIHPILTGNLDTTLGATYEICYTLMMPSSSRFNTYGSMSFGNDTSSFSFYFPQSTQSAYQTNIFDYNRIATSTTTTMTFYVGFIDTGDVLYLSNFSVTEVPEISAVRLFGFGGCVLLFAQPWRRLFQKWKRN